MDFSNNKINNIYTQKNNISFSGQKAVKNDVGTKVTRFYPPYIPIDKNKEELGIEIVRMANTADKNDPTKPYGWSVISEKPVRVAVDEEFARGAKTYFDVNLSDMEYRMPKGEVGYRFVVYEKDPSKSLDEKVISKDKNGNPRVYTDSAGSIIKDDLGSFTVLNQNQGTPRNAGPMEHIFIDSYNVIQNETAKAAGKKINPNENQNETEEESRLTPEDYAKAVDGVRRNHFNKIGGTIDGITKKTGYRIKSK